MIRLENSVFALNGSSRMDMDRDDWDLDFEDDADESELDDAFEAAAALEFDASGSVRNSVCEAGVQC